MLITYDHIGFVISDIINNQYIKRRYCNFTRKEAIKDFRQYVKELA
jgi:hypothetical protein